MRGVKRKMSSFPIRRKCDRCLDGINIRIAVHIVKRAVLRFACYFVHFLTVPLLLEHSVRPLPRINGGITQPRCVTWSMRWTPAFPTRNFHCAPLHRCLSMETQQRFLPRRRRPGQTLRNPTTTTRAIVDMAI